MQPAPSPRINVFGRRWEEGCRADHTGAGKICLHLPIIHYTTRLRWTAPGSDQPSPTHTKQKQLNPIAWYSSNGLTEIPSIVSRLGRLMPARQSHDDARATHLSNSATMSPPVSDDWLDPNLTL
jgi:hypothetical protein